MITNYLKSGLRNIYVNKSISAINILGLSLGLSAFVIIMLWIENEFSYNAEVKDRDLISAIMVNQSFENGEIQTYAATPPPLAKNLKESINGVEAAATASWGDQLQFSVGNNKFTEFGLYASHDFLDVFAVKLLVGNKTSALQKPNTVIITEDLSKKYFGSSDALGKSILIGADKSYEVVGVMENQKHKSTMRYDFLMPLTDYFSFNPSMINDWSVNNVRTYVKFHPNAVEQKVNSKIKTLLHEKSNNHKNCDLFLFSMRDWYLKGEFKDGRQIGGRIKSIYLFACIGFVILLLSCINFINLTTAGASKRLKEIGVRKSLGANRIGLIKHFLTEALITAILSGLIASFVIFISLPLFNSTFNLNLTPGFSDPNRLTVFLSLVLLVGLLAGSYPAFVLSGLDSIAALKKNAMSAMGNPSMVRKTLVTTQFAVTILLITGAVMVGKQIDFFRNKDLGVDGQNLVWLPNQIPFDKIETAMKEIKDIKGVQDVALSSMTFQGSNNRGHEVSWPGKKQGQDIFFNFIAGSHDLTKTAGLKIVQGRSFSKEFSTDTNSVLINETAAKQMNLKDPIGQIIETKNWSGTIVGVLKDFHFESLHNPIGPAIISCRPDWTWNMYIKFAESNNQVALEEVEKLYTKFAPNQIFEYNFQNDQPKWFYRSVDQTSFLIKWFAGFAVFLSCLGLLGLTLFTIERKKKEIAIRKVLGASIYNIWLVISSQYIFLILVSIVLAIIPAFYFTNQWLENFAYRIEIKWYYFLIGPIFSIVLAMITIGILSAKAALMNPVKSIRIE